ncbi:hypothetical protein ACFP3U_26955 [Kitasatospora misakiensis]|uniref:DUF3592 domain-containing protein n=1 Tax=Kitasatospora misakiensis TaxID=67330 RepID=A0ABW0XBS9_9ACTN
MIRIIVRCCAGLLGLVAVWVGIDLAGEPYRDSVQFRHAGACPVAAVADAGSGGGAAANEGHGCIGRETGRVVDKKTSTRTTTTGSTDTSSTTTETVYLLSVRRSSGTVERIEVGSSLYAGAEREAVADLETWYGELVGVTVAGRHHGMLPSSSGRLVWDLLLAWVGLGVLLWSVLGGGQAITFFGIMGHRAFAWVWFGLWTLWPVTGLVAGGASWSGLLISAVFWLFGAVIAVVFFRNDNGFGRRARRRRWRTR